MQREWRKEMQQNKLKLHFTWLKMLFFYQKNEDWNNGSLNGILVIYKEVNWLPQCTVLLNRY